MIPINISAGDITSIGMELIRGDKNRNGKNMMPANTAVRPVRQPCAIPTPDSTTTVDGLVPIMPDTVAPMASTGNVFLSSLSL